MSDFQFEKINGKQIPYSTITDSASVKFSVIAPAYNEQDRVCGMLDETLQYLEERQKSDKSFTFEIIIVNDGSRDKTDQVVRQVRF